MPRIIALMFSAPLLLAAVMAAAQTPSPHSQQEQASSGVVATKMTTAHATVEAVDHANRTATLRADDGREITVDVPESVRNFNQVEKGDKINIEYQEATAILVRKPEGSGAKNSGSTVPPSSAAPSASQYGTVKVAPYGQKQAAVETRVLEIAATVEDVDYGKRTITLRGPQGNVRTIDVGDRVQNLDQIKKGDQVVVRRTEAVAASVTK
jgi:hypothetical protein